MPRFHNAARMLLDLGLPSPSATHTSTDATDSSRTDIEHNIALINQMLDEEEEEDIDEVDEVEEDGNQVQDIFRANIVDATRETYQRSQRRLAVWIFQQWQSNQQDHYRLLLHDDLFHALERNNSVDSAKPIFTRASPDYHPINLRLLSVNDFIRFLLSMTPPGEFMSKSGYGNHRAALFDLFRECKVRQSDDFTADLEKSFAGLKRKSQQFKVRSIVFYVMV